MARSGTRVRAAIGLPGILVSTVGCLLHGDLPMGMSGTEIVRWAAGTNVTAFAVGIYTEIIGYLLFLHAERGLSRKRVSI